MEKFIELNNYEILNVFGVFWVNVLGVIVGGIGGFYGVIIGGGCNVLFSIIVIGIFVGMGVGVLSLVKGFSFFVIFVGGGLVLGVIVNLVLDLEGLEIIDE